MNQKLVKDIARNMQMKSTEELMSLYVENDRGQYSEEAFEAMRQILAERQQPIPAQKERVLPEKPQPIAQYEIEKAIKIGRNTLLLWGGFNTVLWFVWGSKDRATVMERFAELKPLLWFLLYSGLIIGVLMLIFGFIGFVKKRASVVLFSGIMLLFVSILNISDPFLTSLALAEYGYDIEVAEIISQGGTGMWMMLGILQFGWGANEIKKYLKIKRELC